MKSTVSYTLFIMLMLFIFNSQAYSQITSTKSGDWNDSATWTGGVVPTATDNVIVSNTVTVNIPDAVCNDLTVADGGRVYFAVADGLGLTVNGSIVVNSNGRIQAAGSTPSSGQYFQTINLKKDLTVDSGGRFDMRQSSSANLAVCRVLFFGSSNSTINLSLDTYTSNTEEFNSVEINKSGGAKVILASGNLFQNNNSSNGPDTLVLTSGIIETGSNHWVILKTSSSAIQGASQASYINGIIGHGISNGSGTSTVEFPVGDATTYRPITIKFNAPSNSTGHNVWVGLHTGNAAIGSSTFAGGIDKVSSIRYYEVGYDKGSSGASSMDLYKIIPTYKTDDGVTTGNTNLRVAYALDSLVTWNGIGPDGYTTNPPAEIESDSLNPNISLASGSNMYVALASAQGTIDNPLPVEISLFTYKMNHNAVSLIWNTSTEKNNSGFEIQRSNDNVQFKKIGFIQGAGTSTDSHSYSFADKNINSSKIFYRLKQIDLSGKYNYSKTIEVNVALPADYLLKQNYPNPFNPSTTISYSIPKAGFVSLNIYNTLGQKVKELVKGFRAAGDYSVHFDAKNLQSGIYFYKLETKNFIKTMKMMLVK